MRTASALGDAIPDKAWREFRVGDWEGLTSAEITQRFPGQLEAFLRGENVAPGGGELMSDFGQRVVGAFNAVVAALPSNGHAVVVTHGGVIWSVVAHVLGLSGGIAFMIPSHNTASTTIRVDGDGVAQLVVFNDATHLSDVPIQYGPKGTTVSIFRHGQTEGNLAGRWQGRSDSPLTATGREQVAAASVVAPRMSELFTSPLGRTVETASIIGTAMGISPSRSDGLMEMAFGEWENMTVDEAVARNPELFDLIFNQGEDRPRGGNGESFAQAGERLYATVESLATTSAADHIGAVSHGAAIRAYITNVLGLPFADRDRFPIPRNSSMSQVRLTPNGPVLAAYNVAPHLDM